MTLCNKNGGTTYRRTRRGGRSLRHITNSTMSAVPTHLRRIFAEPAAMQGINPRARAKSIPDLRSAGIVSSPNSRRMRAQNSTTYPRSLGASPTGKSVRSGPVTFRLEQHQQQTRNGVAHRNSQVYSPADRRKSSGSAPSAGPLVDACRAVVCSSARKQHANPPRTVEDRAAAGPRTTRCVCSTSMSVQGSAPLQVL